MAERSVRKGRRKLIHRESFRASVLHLSEIPAVLAKHCGEEVSLDNAFVLIERHPKTEEEERSEDPGFKTETWGTRTPLQLGRSEERFLASLEMTGGGLRPGGGLGRVYLPALVAGGGWASRMRTGKRGKAKVPETSSMMLTWQR